MPDKVFKGERVLKNGSSTGVGRVGGELMPVHAE